MRNLYNIILKEWTRRGRGKGNKPGSGPGGSCVCPKCGKKVKHTTGERCLDVKCPKCGTKMVKK